jgi:hypothetical protein
LSILGILKPYRNIFLLCPFNFTELRAPKLKQNLTFLEIKINFCTKILKNDHYAPSPHNGQLSEKDGKILNLLEILHRLVRYQNKTFL